MKLFQLSVVLLVSIAMLTNAEEEKESGRSVDLCAKYGSRHTMCLKSPGPNCLSSVQAGLGFTDSEKKLMLDLHNEKRRILAKGQDKTLRYPAANMRKLVWSDDLERVAQRWADQCIKDHENTDRIPEARWIPEFDKKKYSVGQNFHYYGKSKDTDATYSIERAVKEWYDDEIGLYVAKKGTGENYIFSSGTGHMTQIAFADTEQIGCGYIRWRDGKWYKHITFCNYAIGQNSNGFMYKHGKACSACPQGTTCQDGLCA